MENKIDCSIIKVGIMFNEPVFFHDGKSMFLGANKRAKPYHVAALKRWSIPYLLTSGTPLSEDQILALDNEIEDLEEIEEFEDAETLEELEEL